MPGDEVHYLDRTTCMLFPTHCGLHEVVYHDGRREERNETARPSLIEPCGTFEYPM